ATTSRSSSATASRPSPAAASPARPGSSRSSARDRSSTMRELARSIATQTKLSQNQTLELMHRFLEGITDALLREGRLRLGNFGIFEVKVRKARTSRNPRTGEKVQVPPKTVAHFKPGLGLRGPVGQLKEVPRPGAKQVAAPAQQ